MYFIFNLMSAATIPQEAKFTKQNLCSDGAITVMSEVRQEQTTLNISKNNIGTRINGNSTDGTRIGIKEGALAIKPDITILLEERK